MSVPRPDGTDPFNQYKGHATWMPRRWAWEFLRRNPKFIEACKSVAAQNEEGQAKIAKTFGLKKFKSHRESFRGGSGTPSFLPSSIAMWSNVEGNPPERRRFRQWINAGQVFVRFDLVPAMDNTNALDAQIRDATTRLGKQLDMYIKNSGRQRAKKRSAQSTHFMRHLQILDLLASKHNQNETLRIVNSSILKGKGRVDDSEIHDTYKQQIKQARNYSDRDYLIVASLTLAGSKKSK